jgi:uncharacterized protein YyaL (SSP411 family)
MRVRAAVAVLLLSAVAATARAEEPVSEKVRPTNRLAGERSPYLRQHMHNPVDWWPWGKEALAEAKAKDKPIFLSIGYAACHWCHVMEHESFEDEGAARALNDAFVCVKVDREERPDLDEVYMTAVQLTSGRGGWPMTCLLLPDGRPFLARTYLPRDSLIDVTRSVRRMWQAPAERARLTGAAEEIAAAIRAHAASPTVPFAGTDDDLVKAAVDAAAAEFDDRHGGFDRVPKFPPHSMLLLLLDRGGAAGGARGLAMARKTLAAMAAGGICDQVGGGFHRYSTDGEWLVPHFEKMLYDNALLATAYAAAFELDGEARWARVVRATLGWIEREMTVAGGGYASSLDADTNGEEGLTYAWTLDELRAALPAADARSAERVFGAVPAGNWLDEASGRPTGRNILHLPVPLAEVATRDGVPLDGLVASLERIRARLLEVRAKRPQPGRDGKVLTAWNGLLLTAFARAGAALKEPVFLDRGRALARFLLEKSRDGTRLLRFPKDSGPAIPGFLDDHAHLAEGLLDLADATGEPAWADAAKSVCDEVLARFADPTGAFPSSGSDHEVLLARGKDVFDSPIPSANASVARALLRVSVRTGDARYREACDRTIAALRGLAARAPTGATAMIRLVADRRALAARGATLDKADVTVRRAPATIDVFLERAQARPGTKVRVLVRVTLDAGFHVNAPVPSRPELVATTLAAAKGPAELVGIVFPAAEPLPGTGTPPVAGYDGAFDVAAALSIPAGAPPGPRKIGLLLSFQPCDASSCRAPEEVRIDVPLRFADEDGPALHPATFRAVR